MPARALALVLFLNGFAGCSSATGGGELPARSVLFVGNSLTYTNDLPALFAGVARAAGDSARVGMAADANLAVIDHTNGATDALDRIDAGDWAFVVLQQGPTPAGICRDTLVIAAMRFAPHVRAAGGRVVLFLPWTRQSSPAGLTVASESATLAARAAGGVAAPVGLAWKLALEADPTLPLYGSDGYHPAPVGSLLAALTIYDRLSGRDVRAIPAADLAAITAVALTPAQLQRLSTSAHAAATSLPRDPTEPVPADTTHLSSGGGPC